jgi:hypothetical protein
MKDCWGKKKPQGKDRDKDKRKQKQNGQVQEESNETEEHIAFPIEEEYYNFDNADNDNAHFDEPLIYYD